MKLLKLDIENYRRFVGKHSIEFAAGDEKNVTVIRAKNGAGKTGILMALLFGLFGVVEYDQFRIEKDDEDTMVSRPLLINNKKVSTTVSIEFINNNSKFKIVRIVQAQNINNKIRQDNNNIKTILYEDGIEIETNPDKINSFMNSIIGENIRDFLFFDGVRYMELFKEPSMRAKKELKKIIEKMLNIGDLDETIGALNFLKSNFSNGSEDKKLNSQIVEVKNKIYDLENRISELNTDIDESQTNLEKYESDYKKQIFKRSEDEKYADIVKERSNLFNEKDLFKQSINNYLDRIKRDSASNLVNIINFNIGNQVKNDFSRMINHSYESTALLDNILINNKCICCDEQLTDKKRTNIKNLLSSMKKNDKSPKILSDLSMYVVNAIDKSGINIDNNFEGLYNELKSLINEFYDIEDRINEINSQLPFDTDEDQSESVTRNIKNLGVLEQLIKDCNTNISLSKDKINQNKSDLDKERSKLDEFTRRIAENEKQLKKFDIISSTHQKLTELKKEYLDNAQSRISLKANEYFIKLLSDDDKSSIKRLNINKDYVIEAYNNFDQEVFSDLSAGQKLLASMAFTMGLTAVASDAKPTTNYPLVMDTPMSNLDLGNRKRLIEVMPQSVNQWILTPMDTELRDEEIDYFDSTGKVGKVYQLVKEQETSSIMKHDNILRLKEDI